VIGLVAVPASLAPLEARPGLLMRGIRTRGMKRLPSAMRAS